MLQQLIYYLVGTLFMIGGLLVLERLLAGRHSTASTGFARVDGAFDVERLRWQQYGAQAFRLVRGGQRTDLPVLTGAGKQPRQLRDAGEQLVRIDRILGSVYGGSPEFDRRFRPLTDHSRARLSSILVAMRAGEPLPPVDLWACGGSYFVVDGHHRVAAARALGLDLISARVVVVG